MDLYECPEAHVAREGDIEVGLERRMEAAAPGKEQPEPGREQEPMKGEVHFFHCF